MNEILKVEMIRILWKMMFYEFIKYIQDYEHKGINKQLCWHNTTELKCVFLIIILNATLRKNKKRNVKTISNFYSY